MEYLRALSSGWLSPETFISTSVSCVFFGSCTCYHVTIIPPAVVDSTLRIVLIVHICPAAYRSFTSLSAVALTQTFSIFLS